MAGPTSAEQRGTLSIWDCLNADDATVSGSDRDLIGLNDIIGFESWQDNSSSPQTESRQVSLSDANVNERIGGSLGTPPKAGQTLCSQVLVGSQIVGDDMLHPPDEALAIRFSRAHLCSRFAIPPIVLERMSRRSSWHITLPRSLGNLNARCEGLGTGSFSFAYSVDSETNMLYGILVFFLAVNIKEREKFLRDFEVLGHFGKEESFMPYLVTHLAYRISSYVLRENFASARRADLRLERFAGQRDLYEIFGGTHAQASAMGPIDADMRNVLKLAQGCLSELGKPVVNSNHPRNIERQALSTGFHYLIQAMEIIVEDVKRFQDHTNRRLQTALSMIAHAQQKTSIEIANLSRQDQQTNLELAEASRTIAEETKKDGSSMKTLAVMTMLYLPGTAISSLLSMPLFSWSGQEGRVVNSKIWIYFVLTVPLTVLTIVLWWLWQRQVARRSTSSRIPEKAVVNIVE